MKFIHIRQLFDNEYVIDFIFPISELKKLSFSHEAEWIEIVFSEKRFSFCAENFKMCEFYDFLNTDDKRTFFVNQTKEE